MGFKNVFKSSCCSNAAFASSESNTRTVKEGRSTRQGKAPGAPSRQRPTQPVPTVTVQGPMPTPPFAVSSLQSWSSGASLGHAPRKRRDSILSNRTSVSSLGNFSSQFPKPPFGQGVFSGSNKPPRLSDSAVNGSSKGYALSRQPPPSRGQPRTPNSGPCPSRDQATLEADGRSRTGAYGTTAMRR